MTEEAEKLKESFLYPIGNYYGEFTPENLVFNANLQQFAQQVSYLCGLESNGKISPEDAYDEIKKFWRKLEQSKKELLDRQRKNLSNEE